MQLFLPNKFNQSINLLKTKWTSQYDAMPRRDVRIKDSTPGRTKELTNLTSELYVR